MDTMIKDFELALIVFSLCYLLVLLAICVDLWSGIRKAKKAGVARMSNGFRRTVDKVCQYYNGLFAVSVIDCFVMLLVYILQGKGWIMSFPLFPIVTLLAGGYLAFIEACSVFEKLEEKDKARLSSDMNKLIEITKDEKKLNKLLELLKDLK